MRGMPELSLATIEDLKGKGFNQTQIAEMFGVSRQAISYWKRTYGGRLTPREEALKHFPWKVKHPQTQAQPYRFLRDHAEYMATGGKGMDEVKLARLRTLYRKINAGYVIEYDPAIPAKDGVSIHGGWAYRKRRKTDGELLVRVNEHTVITSEGQLLWRLPPRLP